VNDPITWLQRHAATVADKVWQSVVGGHIDWLWVSGLQPVQQSAAKNAWLAAEFMVGGVRQGLDG
jgi:hypothetical protein